MDLLNNNLLLHTNGHRYTTDESAFQFKTRTQIKREATMNKSATQKAYYFNNYYNYILLAASACAMLIFALQQCQTANAHSLMSDNSIEQQQQQQHNNGNRHQNGNQMKSLMLQNNNPNGNQNRCQSGWMWFNNKCWVTSQSRRDFVHAIDLCKKMYNSTLPTIHSEDENEFLRQNIDLHNSPIWLYARHNHQYNKTRWLDKSPVNYTRWDAGQPSDKSSLICIKTEESWYMKKAEPVDGQTECVSFWEDAKWGTQVGCLVLLPVVCEKKLTPISRYSDGPNGTLSAQQIDQLNQMNQLSLSSANDLHVLQPMLYILASSLTTLLIRFQFQGNQISLYSR